MHNLEQAQVTENSVRLDQGITDKNFILTFVGTQKMDQFNMDEYVITVQSKYFDGYNHETKNWGSYVVESVSCSMAQ